MNRNVTKLQPVQSIMIGQSVQKHVMEGCKNDKELVKKKMAIHLLTNKHKSVMIDHVYHFVDNGLHILIVQPAVMEGSKSDGEHVMECMTNKILHVMSFHVQNYQNTLIGQSGHLVQFHVVEDKHGVQEMSQYFIILLNLILHLKQNQIYATHNNAQ